MDWVKRNLYFLIGGTVSLVLMGLAGYYLSSTWQLTGEIREKLNAEYAELQRLNRENPHPGDKKVNNVQAAKEGLMRQFLLSEIQATYILDTPQRRLTRFDRFELAVQLVYTDVGRDRSPER